MPSQPSLSLVPSTASTSTSVSHAADPATLNSQGLHDTLTYGPRSVAGQVAPKHPLEQRLGQWKETQDTLKFTMQRQVYGVHMPVRQLMERALVTPHPHMPARGAMSNLHLDILTGNDELLETKDLFVGNHPTLSLDMHKDMERKLNI